MPAASVVRRVADGLRPQIFSQEDRKIGRFLGFTHSTNTYDTTQSMGDRWALVAKRVFHDWSNEVIAACIAVHRDLGPGLLEGIYEECLCRELTERGIRFERQKSVTVVYRGAPLEQAYRMDLVVEGSLLVEIKAVESLLPVHAAQVVTYLRVSGLEHGLLVNFNAMTIRAGLRRLSRTHQSFRSSDLPVKKSGSV
jgi:GxxExxY protein